MTDLGTDISAVDDIDANLSLAATPELAFAQALVRRITTPRGALWYAPSYGYDIGAHVNTATDVSAIQSAAEAELLQDERVDDAEVTITVTEPDGESTTGGKTWTADIRVVTGDGPFAFTLGVDAVTGALLLSLPT